MAKQKSFKTVNLNLMVSHLTDEKPLGKVFLPPGRFTVILDYPFDDEYRFTVSSKWGMTAYDLAVRVAQRYAKIYGDRKLRNELGIWGHEIGDLGIEGFRVNLKANVVDVYIGS